MGPKLLVSDVSTAQQPVLRWQLRVRGNTAVEFGVIPADLAVRACQRRLGAAARGGAAWRWGAGQSAVLTGFSPAGSGPVKTTSHP